jgi:hypothetical protein
MKNVFFSQRIITAKMAQCAMMRGGALGMRDHMP